MVLQLLQLCPDIPSELKSAVVLARFDALPTIRKTEIWTTLGKVSIHVVDPRPYKTSVDSLLRKAMKREDAPEFLRQSASEGFVWARNLHLRTQAFAAESILGDSIASRAHRLSHAFGQDAFIMPFERVEPPELVTVEDFNCDPKGVVRKSRSGLQKQQPRSTPAWMPWTHSALTTVFTGSTMANIFAGR